MSIQVNRKSYRENRFTLHCNEFINLLLQFSSIFDIISRFSSMLLMVKISVPETLKLVLYSRNMMMSTLALSTALMIKFDRLQLKSIIGMVFTLFKCRNKFRSGEANACHTCILVPPNYHNL